MSKKSDFEALVKSHMEKLDISEEEARQLVEDDKLIDKGKDLFPLSKDQIKASRQARQTGTNKKPVYKFDQRKVKENPTKRELIELLFEAVKDYENATVTNPERVIAFSVGEDNFEIVLQQKRKPKK